MEKFDLYDDDRIPLGKQLERGQKCGEGENRQVVHVCIFNSKGEMLIQQRVNSKKDWPGLWDFSLGGCAIAGETSKEAAHRETLEELGLDYNFTNHRPHLTINFEKGFDDYYFIEMDLDIKELTLQESEVQAVKWATKEEILSLRKDNKFIPHIETFIVSLFDLRLQRGTIRDFFETIKKY